jgi:hypothetical protein
MPTSPTDVFYVIGYTNEQVLEGGIHHLMTLDGYIMRSLAYLNQQLGPLKNAEASGVVVEEPVEIYTAMRVDGNPYGDKFQDIVFMNDVALRLCRIYGVRLTPVIAKITRSQMPATPALLMKKRVYTPKADAGVSPERIPAFRNGDYVRPRGGGATMGTIVDTKYDGEKFQYHFRQDLRFHSLPPPTDAYWLEEQMELWPRPTDAEVNLINKLVKGR